LQSNNVQFLTDFINANYNNAKKSKLHSITLQVPREKISSLHPILYPNLIQRLLKRIIYINQCSHDACAWSDDGKEKIALSMNLLPLTFKLFFYLVLGDDVQLPSYVTPVLLKSIAQFFYENSIRYDTSSQCSLLFPLLRYIILLHCIYHNLYYPSWENKRSLSIILAHATLSYAIVGKSKFLMPIYIGITQARRHVIVEPIIA
jgi:hypothetical protein